VKQAASKKTVLDVQPAESAPASAGKDVPNDESPD